MLFSPKLQLFTVQSHRVQHGEKIGGKERDLFGYFLGGFVYGTIQVLFGYTQVWEEGKDASYNPFLPTTYFTMIHSSYKVELMNATDFSDFLQFCN